jgi:hypothetical protein
MVRGFATPLGDRGSSSSTSHPYCPEQQAVAAISVSIPLTWIRGVVVEWVSNQSLVGLLFVLPSTLLVKERPLWDFQQPGRQLSRVLGSDLILRSAAVSVDHS